MSAVSAPDQNLLLGVLALQNHLIDRDTLIGALKSWAREPGRSLGELLVERGDLSPPERASLEAMLAAQIARQSAVSSAEKKEQRTAPLASMAAVSQTLDLFANDDLAASLQAAGVSAPLLDPAQPPRSGTYAATLLDAKGAAMDASGGFPLAGRFRPLRLHARGGLGEVFVAQDEELHREVALKEIQGKYAADSDARLRFLREAEITGGLEHPGIVPVYGLGAYPDGRPYYAMRFVRGETLRDAIAAHHGPVPPEGRDPGERDLALRKLLGRFLAACNAIDYAHNRGVIHRDIKPENILIGPFGETLVVDWGLARAQGRDDRRSGAMDATLQVPSGDSTSTRQGAILGTPAYMSPEQALGWNDALTPASDIYSLGATLYALLAGQAPFTGAKDVSSLLQRVQTGDFPQPRTITSEIPEPLEAICLKAMSIKASQRYASARELADDVEAWLADQPVSAYQEPWWSQARRWVRRNQTLVAGTATATGVALIALIIGVVMLSLYNEQLRVARDQAQENFRLARSAVDQYFFIASNDERLKSKGFESLRRNLLRAAESFYDRFLHQEKPGNVVYAESLAASIRLAEICQEVESAKVALQQVDRAIVICDRWSRAEPEHFAPPAAAVLLLLKRGAILSDLGRHQEAIEAYRKAATKAETLTPSRVATTQYARKLNLADIQRRLGEALYWNDQREESLQAFVSAGKQLAALLPEAAKLSTETPAGLTENETLEAEIQAPFAAAADSKPLPVRLRLSTIQTDVERKSVQAQVLADLGRIRESLELIRSAREEFEPLLAGEQDWSPIPTQWVALLCNYAKYAKEAGDVTAAREQYVAAQLVIDPLLQRHPEVSEYQSLAANVRHGLAIIEFEQGDAEKAVIEMRRAVDTMRIVYKQRPELYGYAELFAKSLGDLARMERTAGNFERAAESVGAAIRIQERLATGDRCSAEHQSLLAANRVFLAESLYAEGRYEEARFELKRAEQLVRDMRAKLPELNAATDSFIRYQIVLAKVLLELREREAAARLIDEASRVVEQELARSAENDRLYKLKALIGMHKGEIAEGSRDNAAAQKEYRAVIEIRQKLAARPGAPLTAVSDLASARHALARVLMSPMSVDPAIEEYGRAVVELRQLVKQAPNAAAVRHQLAQTLLSRAKAHWVDFEPEAALADGHEGIDHWERLLADHPQNLLYALELGESWSVLGEIERTRSMPEVALGHYSKAIDLLAPHAGEFARFPAPRAAYRNARFRRAQIRIEKKEYPEALEDLKVALPIADWMRVEALGLQIYSLRRIGKHTEAHQAIDEFLPLAKDNSEALLLLAAMCGQTVDELASETSLEQTERANWQESYGAVGIKALRAAAATGVFAKKEVRQVLDQDKRFAPLRSRPEYPEWRKSLPE